ncbi:MAG: NAD-dependent epimerase/dehydratase family protein [Acidimicrobiales bacterium]|jgi:nucleoside-diphosphate-sugar epimerase|nr:NAD-dependent epimerase/dehydratase family protein [Acidimicrobiales bacterium]
MRALVTGAAGFIGSHLCEALLARGDEVVGVDCFTPYYDRETKEANLRGPSASPGFRLVRCDLRTGDLAELLDGVDVVYHQAGQPGVRLSWSEGFGEYESCNVLATQRLLEAARDRVGRVVYASSSSVYGNAARYPTEETDLPAPHSPYGVTKLAAEHLCGLYAANWGVHTVALRYFTVYGPRQRPDMAFNRLVAAALSGARFPRYGDGSQVRDFTYVADVVAANLAAGAAEVAPGTVLNVAGGGAATLAELIDLAGELVGRPVEVEPLAAQPGDVVRTGGAIERARSLLGWQPTTPVREGLAAQIAWARAANERTGGT